MAAWKSVAFKLVHILIAIADPFPCAFADEFRVSLQANESSKKHGLSGNYVLKVADCNIALYSATSLIPTQFTLRLTGIKRLQQCSLVDKHGIGEEILVIYTMP